MSASLTLATPQHMERLDALVAAFHAEQGIKLPEEKRRAGLQPLLEGVPHGAAYLIGPARAPIGYAMKIAEDKATEKVAPSQLGAYGWR